MTSAARAIFLVMLSGCGGGDPPPYDLDFDIPRTEDFKPRLSDYGLFVEPLGDLSPEQAVLPYDLSSELYTDYAPKQRLMRIPSGASITRAEGALEYPEGTVLVKTFYYPLDMREPEGERRILETRLLVKTDGVWNAATYVWNDAQTDATVLVDGATTEVEWLDASGASQVIDYGIPHEGECVTCHQSSDEAAYIGPTVANLNHTVSRDDADINQLEYLASKGVLASADWASLPSIPNYKHTDVALEDRARAYLDINCAHCHNPSGWDASTERELDFRYTTELSRSGIDRKADELPGLLEDGEMPYLGTTLPHAEGIQLLSELAASLEPPEQ